MIVALDEALRRLRAGEVVAYPTETVYGLACDPRSRKGLSSLRALKGRDAEKGIALLVADVHALAHWVARPPRRALALAARFWPGPLTLVLEGARAELASVATPLGVGFRCSPQPTAAALVRSLGVPLSATSANRAGEPPAQTSAEIERCFGADFPIAGGEDAGGGLPSTVVAVAADGALVFVREGALAFRELETTG